MAKYKKTQKRSFYYHVTRENMGSKIVLSPRAIRCCDTREPDLDRICVSPTISGCFAAISIGSGEYNVYRTKDRVLAHIPKRVADVSVTREKWLLEPTEFVRVCKIPKTTVYQLPDGGRGDESELWNQAQEKKEIKEILNKYLHSNKTRMKNFQLRV